MKEFQYLGKKINKPSKQLDTFPAPENINLVKFESNELTCFCPVTGQPDFYSVTIEFIPDKLCIESKSLKLYLWSLREEAVFAETLAHTIVEDIFNTVKPEYCKVLLTQNIRGGLQLSTIAEKKK